MAEPPITGNTSQQWTDPEIESILQHLITKRSEIGDARNFKKKTYTSATEAIPGQTRTWEQDTSGVHWDTPDNAEIRRGANVTTDAEAQPFKNKGWQWLPYMKKIIPVAGETGIHLAHHCAYSSNINTNIPNPLATLSISFTTSILTNIPESCTGCTLLCSFWFPTIPTLIHPITMPKSCAHVTFRHTLLRSDSVGVVSGSPYSVPVLSLVSDSTPPTSNSKTSPYHSDSSDDIPNPLPHVHHNNYSFVITFPLSVSTPAMDYSPKNAGSFPGAERST
ncbi:hypothetical protein BYT27DRAFT_7212960 [Phlegmacium glaucopus]|nr:hypothetical protein BYT27DRAFT_7212960 [Phlegmacium glaucopus]